MNPYEVLGVEPGATADDIEGTYRRLLRAHHPDLHHGASGPELADAEARTRELNEAIALIRAGWHPPTDAGRTWPWLRADGSGWDGGFHVDPGTDWFGHPYSERRTPDPVECPLCRTRFDDARVFRLHLERVHHLREDTFMSAPRRRQDRLYWLAWIPAPPLTFAGLLFVYLAVVLPLLRWPWTVPAIWLGVILATTGAVASIRRRHVY